MFSLYMNHLRPNLGDDQRLYWDYDAGYADKVLGYSPIAYWPLWEIAGSQAIDISGNGFHGTYIDVLLGQPGIGDGRAAPFFDGSTSLVNAYSTGLRDAFNVQLFTISAWINVYDWEDGNVGFITQFEKNSNNVAYMRKDNDNNKLEWRYAAAGTVDERNKTSVTETGWMHIAQTVSLGDDKHIAYYNGAQEGAIMTGLGTWNPADKLDASRCCIGSEQTGLYNPFTGHIAHVSVYDAALAAASILDIATV